MLTAVLIFQMAFAGFILIDSDDPRHKTLLRFSLPDSLQIGFTRFVAAMVMHIYLHAEIFNGLKIMKYSINHEWKFKHPSRAFTVGFMQFFIMIMNALINYAVISSANTVLEVAQDFTALIIIAQIDNIFVTGIIGEEKAKEILRNYSKYKELFKIETTTSDNAKGEKDMKMNEDKIFEGILKNGDWNIKLERPKSIRLSFWRRNFENRILYAIYRILRILHVSIWFYTVPFLFLVAMYFVPVKEFAQAD